MDYMELLDSLMVKGGRYIVEGGIEVEDIQLSTVPKKNKKSTVDDFVDEFAAYVGSDEPKEPIEDMGLGIVPIEDNLTKVSEPDDGIISVEDTNTDETEDVVIVEGAAEIKEDDGIVDTESDDIGIVDVAGEYSKLSEIAKKYNDILA